MIQAEQAYIAVRDLIVNAELPPGSTILEKELQAKLQVGRTPLREALHRLANEQMVRIYPRRAIVVAKFDLADIQHLFEMRQAVESAAAALAAQRATASQIDHLRCLHEATEQASCSFELMKFLDLNRTFHQTIADYSGSRFIREAVSHVLTLNRWIWNSNFSKDTRIDIKFLSHQPILDAIARGDSDEAEQVMKEHLHKSRVHLLRDPERRDNRVRSRV